MPQWFKSLTSIAVCSLFAVGFSGFFAPPVIRFVTREESWSLGACGVSIAALVLAAVIVRFSQYQP